MLSAEEFAGRCGKWKKTGNRYMCRCPAHDDKKASLSVEEGEKGLLIKCHAGCRTEDVLQALGLEWKDLFRDSQPQQTRRGRKSELTVHKAVIVPPDPPQEKKPVNLNTMTVGGMFNRSRITRMYSYKNADGLEVLRVYRTEGKDFPTIHLDKGTWYWGDGGIKLLYRLPEVLAGIKAGKTIHIVEGEKDVETLESYGLIATTNKGGAGKWNVDSREWNEALRGARVVIIPDIDRVGMKNGETIANALDGTAREVTLVNLKRLGLDLPEKGDVSDAAAILGDSFLGALTDLIQRSPVLSRIVSDDDYQDYFVGIRGCKCENGRIMGYKNESWYPLSSFVALPIEQIELDDGLTEPSYLLRIAGWSWKGYRLRTLDVPLTQFVEMSWLTKWGVDAVIDEGSGAKQKLRRIIQEAGSRVAVMRHLYAHTGWREINGSLCFLHGGGAIGQEDAQVKLDYGFTRYRLDGWSDPTMAEYERKTGRQISLDASWRCMTAAGLRIGAPLVAMMYLTPLKYFLEKRGHRPSMIPFVSGETGSGKTVISSLILNHFGYDFGFESSAPATYDDTVGGISLKMFELKDMPLLIDDYHPVDDARKAQQMAQMAEAVGRMIGDGMRRSRMRADTTAQEDKPARCLAIGTGEQPPNGDVASSAARLYIIQVKRGDVPIPGWCQDQKRLDEMNELRGLAGAGALNEAMRGYIEWLIPQSRDLPLMLESKLEALQRMAIQKTAGMNLHGRIPQGLAYLMLGLDMMMTYMQESLGHLPGGVDAHEMTATLWDALMQNTEEQRRDMAEEAPVNVFIETLKDLKHSGVITFQTVQNWASAPPKGMIGYMDEHWYYLYFGQACAAVQQLLNQQGGRMVIGKNTLLRMMADQGLVSRGKGGEHTRQYSKGSLKFRAVWMPRSVLDGKDEPQEVQLDMGTLPF